MVTIDTPVRVGARTWRVTWSSDAPSPTFRVYRNGTLLASTTATSATFVLEPGEALVVEVLDDESTPATVAYPGRLELQWRSIDAAAYHRIDELVGADWVERARVAETGAGYLHWRTRFLADDTSHSFRIVPVGTDGNAGTARELTCLMVRHPDPPDVSFTYDPDTGVVTIAEV